MVVGVSSLSLRKKSSRKKQTEREQEPRALIRKVTPEKNKPLSSRWEGTVVILSQAACFIVGQGRKEEEEGEGPRKKKERETNEIPQDTHPDVVSTNLRSARCRRRTTIFNHDAVPTGV